MSEALQSLRRLSDEALIERVKESVAAERRATATLIASLSELDVRRLYLAAGFRSLFDYCVRHLQLSEPAAYKRIEAARLVRRFPILLELLADSRLSLTVVARLAKHLTEGNHKLLLERVTHKTVAEVELVIASLNPQPDAPSLVRRLPSALPAPAALKLQAGPNSSPASEGDGHDAVMNVPSPVRPSPRDVVKPLAAERYKVQFTISLETRYKVRAAQNLLRHSIPNGDLGLIFDRALSLLIVDLEKKKFGVVAHPRRAARPARAGTRQIPAAVRREVWRRDRGRCAFVGTEGRCRERAHLELHHVKPFAAGGESTASNIQLRCRAHNQYEDALGATRSG